MVQITMNNEVLNTEGQISTRISTVVSNLEAIARVLDVDTTPREVRQHLKAKRQSLKVELKHLQRKRGHGQF